VAGERGDGRAGQGGKGEDDENGVHGQRVLRHAYGVHHLIVHRQTGHR